MPADNSVKNLRLTPNEEKQLREELYIKVSNKLRHNSKYASQLRNSANKVAITRPNSVPLTNDEIIQAEVEEQFNDEVKKRRGQKGMIVKNYFKGGRRTHKRTLRKHKRRTHRR